MYNMVSLIEQGDYESSPDDYSNWDCQEYWQLRVTFNKCVDCNMSINIVRRKVHLV